MEEFIKFNEVENILGVSRATVTNLVQRGSLKEGSKIGRNKTVTKESFEKYKDTYECKSLVAESQKRKSKVVAIATTTTTNDSDLARIEMKIDTLTGLVKQLLEQKKPQHAIIKLEEKKAKVEKKTQQEALVTLPPPQKEKNEIITSDQRKKMESYIKESIDDYAISRTEICPAGKGTQLGRWYREEVRGKDTTIAEWYKNAKRLRGEQISD